MMTGGKKKNVPSGLLKRMGILLDLKTKPPVTGERTQATGGSPQCQAGHTLSDVSMNNR